MNEIRHSSYSQQVKSHKNELKNLKAKQNLELEKEKFHHAKQKNQLKTNHLTINANLQSQHEKNLAAQMTKNEKTLKKLKASLDEVKLQTENEKKKIQEQSTRQQELIKADQKSKIENETLKTNLKLQDLSHQESLALQKLQRRMKTQKHDLETSSREELSGLKTQSKQQISNRKKDFELQHLAQEDKFQQALQRQRKSSEQQLKQEEKAHLVERDKKLNLYSQELSKIEQDFQIKNTAQKERFEKTYSHLYEQNEKDLQNLHKNSQRIINHFKNLVREKTQQEIDKSDDIFYQSPELTPQISFQEKSKKYLLELELEPYEVNNVNISAQGREIKLSFDRQFKSKKTYDDGRKSQVSKVESLTSKFPVEHLLNSKEITQKYENGKLKVFIGLA